MLDYQLPPNDPALERALDEGRLVDVGLEPSCPILLPVFASKAVWERLIVPPPEVRSIFQTKRGRASRMLDALGEAVWKRREEPGVIVYPFKWTLRLARHPRWSSVHLKAVVTAGSGGKGAYLVVMLAEEG